jgi:hypothetical protein
MRIYKYELIPGMTVDHFLPVESNVLHIGEQGGGLFMWCEISLDGANALRTFDVVGTGHDFDPGGKYLGSAVMGSGLVWHAYEVTQ